MTAAEFHPRTPNRPSGRYGNAIQKGKQRILKSFVLHPYLLIPSFILALFTENIGQVYFRETYRSFWVSLLVVTVLLILSAAVFRSWHKGGFFASVILLLSFSSDQVLSYIAQNAQRNDATMWVIAVVGVWIWLLLTTLIVCLRVRKSFTSVTHILNITTVALLGISILTLGIAFVDYQQESGKGKRVNPSVILNADGQQNLTQDRRDIYYIILDGYARQDVLNEIYELDTSDFLQALERQGFTITGKSSSNYAQTLLSLSSTFNMDYLQNIMQLDKGSYSREPVIDLFANNEVMGFLRSTGYRILTIESGYGLSTIRDVDAFFPRKHQINTFEAALVPDVWETITNLQKYNLALYREDQLLQFENLADVIQEPGPKFVFSHFIMPHPPFVLDRDGNPMQGDRFELNDGSHFTGGREAYRSGYREQVLFASKKIETVVAEILSSYPEGKKPIIIIQGDHGPGLYLNWETFANTCARERFSILNAYYLPDGGQEALYPTISPVNSFRVILNRYFGADLELLPDEHYFSIWKQPYNFITVDEERLARPCD